MQALQCYLQMLNREKKLEAYPLKCGEFAVLSIEQVSSFNNSMLRNCHQLCSVFDWRAMKLSDIMSFPHLVLSAVILWPWSNLSSLSTARLGLWPPCPHQDLRSKASVVQDGDLWRLFQATPTHLSIHWSTVNGETRSTVMWWEKHEPQNFQLFQCCNCE